jgi:raffinose/stachyose/melibiose transport system permease protein
VRAILPAPGFSSILNFHKDVNGETMSTSSAVKAPRKASRASQERTRVKDSNKLQDKKSFVWFLLPGFILFAGLVGLAFVWNIVLSFMKYSGVGTPRFIGFTNYVNLFQDPVFWESFLHAIMFIGAMSIVPTFLGLFIGALIFDYVAPRFGNGASSFLRGALYMPQIVPLTITGIMWVWLLDPSTGVINTFLRNIGSDVQPNWLGDANLAFWSVSVIMVWVQIGYTIVVLMSGMARIDPSLSEAAQIDGASWFQRFRIITVAQLGPEIGVVLLTTTVAALKVFAPIYVMTGGGPGTATQVPAYFSYAEFFNNHRVGYGASIATVLAIVLTILAIVILYVQTRQNEGANKR